MHLIFNCSCTLYFFSSTNPEMYLKVVLSKLLLMMIIRGPASQVAPNLCHLILGFSLWETSKVVRISSLKILLCCRWVSADEKVQEDKRFKDIASHEGSGLGKQISSLMLKETSNTLCAHWANVMVLRLARQPFPIIWHLCHLQSVQIMQKQQLSTTIMVVMATQTSTVIHMPATKRE